MKPGNVSTLALLFGSFLVSAGLSAAPCTASDTVLCLAAQRFSAEVRWRDFAGNTGAGRAVTLTADTGYFWFFSDSNVELVVKVLDARGFNGHFWVFFGALSNVEYTLTVTDSVTGASKTYQNPSGRFASVGDTAAFAAAGTTATHQMVTADGTPTPPESLEAIQKFVDAAAESAANAPARKAASFPPCPGPSTSLYLSNCRFQVEVRWTAQGRYGLGEAVQLTSDTGYFWFFSDNNVELIVKVLDARGFNERFWVFYGALSNVEYTIHVTDTLSGALHVYRNPPNHFASVGDTAAFRGGYGITVQTDPARAASGFISAESGGSLSVTAADGTVFTLEVPPDSLYEDETVTMTPVGSVARFPFAGGLAAGVNIEPSGTPLLQGATLSVHTPAPISRSDETPVAWNGAGEDFFLFPAQPTSGDLRLKIFHLGGYGVARGTDAERQTQLGREPVADGDLLNHQISPLFREGRAAAAKASAAAGGRSALRVESNAEIRQYLETAYQQLKGQMLVSDGDPALVADLIQRMHLWRSLVDPLGPLDQVFPGRSDEILSLFKDMIELALRKIHERCSEDPFVVFEIRRIDRIIISNNLLQRFPELSDERDAVLKCLTFKLRFESTIAASAFGQTLTYTVVAEEVTLRLTDLGANAGNVIGAGLIDHTSMSWTGAPVGECSFTRSQSPSTFRARLRLFASSRQIVLLYDPGTPRATQTATCHGASVPANDDWIHYFEGHHFSETAYAARYGYKYWEDNWLLTGHKDPWAIMIVQQGGPVAEFTTFTLTHTPE